jgi:hypothetical protein
VDFDFMRALLAFMCNNEKAQDIFTSGVEEVPLTVARLDATANSGAVPVYAFSSGLLPVAFTKREKQGRRR